MNDWIKRAYRTFFEAILGFASANILIYFSDISDAGKLKTVICGFVTSAVAAGIAAVINMKRKG